MFFRYPVSAEIQDWIIDNFHWARAKGLFSEKTPLVQASKAFFTAPKGNGPETAKALVRDFQAILGISHIDIAVEPLGVLPPELRHSYQDLKQTAGTFQGDETGGMITYDPALFAKPAVLLSMLAHEVMHQRLHMIEELPPGGAEAEELATDLHVITCGMGILQMAGAEVAGWQGYLSQASRAHALAVFLLARNFDPAEAITALPPHSAKLLTKALRHIGKSTDALAEAKALLD